MRTRGVRKEESADSCKPEVLEALHQTLDAGGESLTMEDLHDPLDLVQELVEERREVDCTPLVASVAPELSDDEYKLAMSSWGESLRQSLLAALPMETQRGAKLPRCARTARNLTTQVCFSIKSVAPAW